MSQKSTSSKEAGYDYDSERQKSSEEEENEDILGTLSSRKS